MDNAVTVKEQAPEKNKKNTMMKVVLTELYHNKFAMVSICILAFIALLGILAPLIAPYDYQVTNMENTFCPPCAEHLFGTDELGRDIFSRWLWGIRYSYGLGLLAPLISNFIGIVIGSVAGYFGGKVDNFILRFMDIVSAMPGMLLAIIISASFGGGWFTTVMALSVGGIPGVVRMLRAMMMTVREQEYVEAAKATNCSTVRQVVKYILPNSLTPLIVGYTMAVGGSIMSAAGLAYIGLGVQPPTPEWGAMISIAKNYVRSSPYMLVIPCIFLALTVISLNVFGDGLRDALDPKMRK